MKTFFIEVFENGLRKRQVVRAERVGTKLWYHVNGETRFFEETSLNRKKSSNEKPSGLTAPMPGKVTKILKKAGDHVQENEVIVVMEAMKMEYSLKAPYSGIIEELMVQTGSLVSLGASLVKLKQDSTVEKNK